MPPLQKAGLGHTEPSFNCTTTTRQRQHNIGIVARNFYSLFQAAIGLRGGQTLQVHFSTRHLHVSEVSFIRSTRHLEQRSPCESLELVEVDPNEFLHVVGKPIRDVVFLANQRRQFLLSSITRVWCVVPRTTTFRLVCNIAAGDH